MSSGYIISIPLRFLGGALVSARLCRLPEQEVHQPSKQELHQQNKRSINIALSVHLRQVHPLEGTRHPIGFRPPPDQIPFATRSDSVRRPIGFRPPSDRFPSAVRSDCVRSPMTHPLQSNDVGSTLEFENLIFRLTKYQKLKYRLDTCSCPHCQFVLCVRELSIIIILFGQTE